MLMKKYNLYYLVSLFVSFGIFSVGTDWLLEKIEVVSRFPYFFLLPMSYVFMALIMLALLNIVNKADQRRILQIMMLLKSFKFLVVVFTGVLFVYGFQVGLKNFLLATGILYLVYLAFESISLFYFEKLVKEFNKKNE